MVPRFSIDGFVDGTALLCPSCGHFNLHHERIEIFERSEDEPRGIHLTVFHGKATFDTSLEGNPSSRRHGLKIRFWCETCVARPVLSFSQDRGTTYVEFE